MSKYTTEVRYICETSIGMTDSEGFNSIEDHTENGVLKPGILTRAAEQVFNFDFPIFDENYRLVLEKKILRHYYTREICEETVGLWKLRLCDRLNMIMPYYNQMYESELIKFNPLYDVALTRSTAGKRDSEENNDSSASSQTVSQGDVSRTEDSENNLASARFATGKTDGNTTTTEVSAQNDNNERWDKYADTPQGAVTGLANDQYLTNARHINDTRDNVVSANGETGVKQDTVNTETGNENATENTNMNETSNAFASGNEERKGKSVITGTESYIENVAGKQGSGTFSKMLIEFRKTFLNIDAMILEELSDLFFGLW